MVRNMVIRDFFLDCFNQYLWPGYHKLTTNDYTKLILVYFLLWILFICLN